MTILESSEPTTSEPEQTEPGHDTSCRSPAQTTPLELTTHQHSGYAVVSARGELNADTVGELTRLAETLAREGRPRLVLDASRLYDLDTTAINKLSELKNTLAAQSGDLWLAAPRPWVRRLLEHMCHSGTFKIHATIAEAATLVRDTAGDQQRP